MQYNYMPTQVDVKYYSAYAADLLNEQPEDFDPLEFTDNSWED